ncbi:MAG: hypothetical protein M5U25_06100 [Planctomycetota bacterium]|nr:hypothetical protein [Planctomycetota bacterium]
MMRRLTPTLIALLLASCTIGSSTTQRPALDSPAIEPDGAFWDAINVARRGDHDSFLYALSPQMVYRALYPEARLREPTSQEEFDSQRAELDEALSRHAAVVREFSVRHMHELDKLVHDRFIEVSKPSYTIRHKDSWGRAQGPNFATVLVTIYPKQPLPEGFKPETIEVRFVQDGQRWLIDGFDNDRLKGAFVR